MASSGSSKREGKFKIKKIGDSEIDVQRSLKEIYKQKDGRHTDISKLERRKGSWLARFTIITFIILIVLSGLAYLSFMVFNKETPSDHGDVDVTIEGPEEIKSGEEIEYKIIYKNNKSVALRKVEAEVLFPEGFTYKESDPKAINEPATIWQDKDVPAGASREIIISGQIIGETESQKNLRVNLTYYPANFNSEFKEVAFHSLKIQSMELEVEIDGPAKAVVEKEITYEIEYKNIGEDDVKNLQFKLNLPTDFDLSEIEPEKIENNNSLTIDKLEEDEKDKIVFSGQFKAGASGDQEIGLEIYLQGESGQYYKQSEVIHTTQIITEGLTLNLIINGSSEDQSVNLDDSLNYSLVYKNVGDDSISDVSVSISIVSEMLDWDSLKDDNQGEFLVNEIVWTKQEVPELALLEAGDEGNIDFSLDFLDKSELLGLAEELMSIESSAEAIISQTGDIKADVKVKSNKIINQLNSDFDLSVEARYFSETGQTVGSGPLPPKVGEETQYRIYWRLENSLHELNDVKVSMVLPDKVSWSNDPERTAGEIRYNQQTKTVTWAVNWMPLEMGVLQAEFSITLLPEAEDLDKILIITNKTAAQALDVLTEDIIYQSANAQTTDLQADSMASGKGVVQ